MQSHLQHCTSRLWVVALVLSIQSTSRTVVLIFAHWLNPYYDWTECFSPAVVPGLLPIVGEATTSWSLNPCLGCCQLSVHLIWQSSVSEGCSLIHEPHYHMVVRLINQCKQQKTDCDRTLIYSRGSPFSCCSNGHCDTRARVVTVVLWIGYSSYYGLY